MAVLSFLQKWHHGCLQRAYTEAEVSHPVGYCPEFLPHLAQYRTIPQPNHNIMTLNLTFSPENQNTLAWVTYYFAFLHHCISSTLSNSQYSHSAQDPKYNCTYTYNHSLSNLSLFQAPLWSSSVFSLFIFMDFLPVILS